MSEVTVKVALKLYDSLKERQEEEIKKLKKKFLKSRKMR